jgi:tetratricopeptide (TPR) repeat protein
MFRVALICVSVLVAVPAFAQQPTLRSAKELYESGINHYNLSEWKEALVDFKEAYRRKPDAVFLFNIAQCYRQLGDPANAQLEYRAYLRETPDAPNREEVQRLITAMDEAIKAQRQPPTGVKVPSDAGQPETTTPAPAPTPAPPTAQKPAQPDPAIVAQRAHTARTERVAGLALIGTGALFVVLGGTFVGLVYEANSAALANNVYHPDQVTNRNTFEILDAVSFAVGGAALVTGAVLYAVGRSQHSYAIAPVVSPSYAGAAATVRF